MAGRRPSVRVTAKELIVNPQTDYTERVEVGFTIRGPGFYVWQETRLEAERWAQLLARMAPGRGSSGGVLPGPGFPRGSAEGR